MVQAKDGLTKEALESGGKALEIDSTVQFEYAQVLTALDMYEEALDQLEILLGNGYRDLPWIKLEPNLLALQNELRFHEMLAKYFD